MTGHVALLGDSILDNAAYTLGGPAVITQLQGLLPDGWQASLLALDGSMIEDLDPQLARLPPDASHLVIAVGGNNVLSNLDVLELRVKSSSEALLKLGQRMATFERAYRKAIDHAISLGREMIVCTIYNGNLDAAEGIDASLLPDPAVARVGLTAFNDVILRVAFENRLPVIDLRLVCSEPADYANPIEPSSRGGEKIARAIVRALGLADDASPFSRVFTD
jgi:hypothetical protein